MPDQEVKPGLRVAVLQERSDFAITEPPAQSFYTGTITRIDPMGLVEITYDENPYVKSIIAGWKELSLFVIPLGKKKTERVKVP